MGPSETRDELQGLLVVMASLSHGLEQVLGRGADTVTFRAGKTVGLKSGITHKESDILIALGKVGEALKANGIEWPFEAWKPASETSFIGCGP